MLHSNITLVAINIYLEAYSQDFCHRHTPSFPHPTLTFYMREALRLPLANESALHVKIPCTENTEEKSVFCPTKNLDKSVEKIAVWLKSSIQNNVEWLHRTNDAGVPLKLTKLYSLEQVLAEAEKCSKRLYDSFNIKSFGPEYGGVRIVKEFENGYKVIQLLDIPALKHVGYEFKNCFRDGDYDNFIRHGERKIYCLVGPQNKLHVAMEVDLDNVLRQCKGRSGDFGLKHSFYITEFLNERDIVVFPQNYEFTKLVIHGGKCSDPRLMNNFNLEEYLHVPSFHPLARQPLVPKEYIIGEYAEGDPGFIENEP